MSGELVELANSVRSLVGSLGVAALEEDVWPHVVELGWLQANVPEELGGLGLGMLAVCAIQQELGRRVAGAPYASAKLAIDAVCQSGLKDRSAWIERLMAGDFVTTPLVESSVQVKNERLAGHASAVPSADRATHMLLCSDEIAALVPMKSVERQERSTWDKTQRLFDIVLPAEGIAPDLVLASGAAARKLKRRLAAQLDLALAADALGGAAASLEMTVEYLQTRKQFGRPLALFQALKHRCADLKANLSAAEALLLDALACQDEELATRAMGAKQFACAVYAQVAEEAIQLHGGIGMTAEHPCHLFLKRAQLDEHLGWHCGRYELATAENFLNS